MAKKNIITKDSEKFLEKYLNNASPTGFEAEGQKLWLNYLQPYIDDYFVDTYGTAVGVINPEAKYKVVIEAHADEISWFVHYIDPQGYIYLRSEYPAALEVLNIAIERSHVAGFLGADICGSGRTFHLEVRLGAGAYICGEETSLLESLEGKILPGISALAK